MGPEVGLMYFQIILSLCEVKTWIKNPKLYFGFWAHTDAYVFFA